MLDVELTRGERFKDARIVYNQHGKQTMDQVVAATGVSKSNLSTIENDKAGSIGDDTVALLAKHYDVSADWLLGLEKVKKRDMDLRAVCRYTGLSEDVISILKLGETVPRALNLLAEKPQWAGDDWNVFKSPLWQLCAALAKLERAAIPAAVEALNNDPAGEYFDAAQKKESLELELFRFEKACREIPAAVFRSDVLHERLTEIEARRYQAKIQEFSQEQEKEADNG